MEFLLKSESKFLKFPQCEKIDSGNITKMHSDGNVTTCIWSTILQETHIITFHLENTMWKFKNFCYLKFLLFSVKSVLGEKHTKWDMYIIFRENKICPTFEINPSYFYKSLILKPTGKRITQCGKTWNLLSPKNISWNQL